MTDGIDVIDLPMGPVRDVVSVEYFDENEDLQTVSTSDYQWARTDEGARIRFARDYTLPDLATDHNFPIIVTFEAGFDDPGASGSGDSAALRLPATLHIAILMLTEHWYEHRGIVDATQTYPLMTAADAILSQIKVYR